MGQDTDRILLHEPAADWAEGFPLGSGRIGAMVRGTPEGEVISFNHDLLWRAAYDGPGVRMGEQAGEIRALCLAGRWKEADTLLRTLLPDQRGVYINPFVPFCDLCLTLCLPEGAAEDYTRVLDMEHGVVSVSFAKGGTRYGWECFCSHRYNAFFLKLTASRPASLCGTVSLFRMPDAECALAGHASYRALALDGCFDEERRFSARLRLANRGGRTLLGRREAAVLPDKTAGTASFGLSYSFDRDTGCAPDAGPSLLFDSCHSLILTLALATDREAGDPGALAQETLDACPDYETALAQHRDDFAALYGRTGLSLDSGPAGTLLEQEYNLSRYLAIAAGRPQPSRRVPKAPINLQGLWCRDTRPAWESDYHTDLNIQMCYWPLAQAGLTEWYEPLLQWAERLLPQAEARARDLYGCEGAAWNACCDPWTLGGTDNVGYGFLGAGAWIMQVLCLYAAYAPSEALLRRLYALMLPTARFLDAMLVPDGDGKRTFPFGSSPVMSLRTAGQVQWLGSAASCDLLLTRELFGAVNAAHRALGLGTADVFDADSVRSPVTDGVIGEWTLPHTENEPGHRHRSPFVCFCPGNSVTPERDPETAAALERLLDRRLAAGSGMSTSFSHVWDAQLLARFHRGGEAAARLAELFRVHLLSNGLLTTNDWDGRGGIGWFADVKVVQLDASLGLISAVTELFCQDQNGYIELLPACPASLPAGSMHGVPGRDGFLTDFAWEAGRVTALTVRSLRGAVCRLRLPGCAAIRVNGAELRGDGMFAFPTKAGERYTVEGIAGA